MAEMALFPSERQHYFLHPRTYVGRGLMGITRSLLSMTRSYASLEKRQLFQHAIMTGSTATEAG